MAFVCKQTALSPPTFISVLKASVSAAGLWPKGSFEPWGGTAHAPNKWRV